MMAMGNNNSVMKVMQARATSTLASVLVALACITFIISSSPAHAASSGRIFGRLLDGSNKNVPVAGQSVTLQMAQGNAATDLASATTDAHGSYAFANLSTDKTTSYALYTHYQGAQYTSDLVTLNTKAVQQVNLTVYQATTSTADMAVVRATILLHKPDAQKGIISVSELVIFRNLDLRTYVGSLDASRGKPNALRFSLPHTAHNVSLGQGFNGYKAIQVDRGFASDAAVPPGDSQFAFTFDMPYSTSSYDFDYTVVYPTVQLTLLIPPEIHASSDTLKGQGPVGANQSTYNLWQANALLANKQVHVQLEGLPAITPVTNSTTFIPTWLMVVLLIMVVILFVTWFLYRSAHRPASRKKRPQQKQHTQRQSKNVRVPAKADRTAEQALLQELLDLDKAFEAGKITKAAYQERRAKIKARLRALMSEKVTS
ncbi:MAG: carboxypeptidase-like regulatory domain-containing protein [Ktedonobacteraceae bacterium]